jgi:tetratricopeptide (TPR) repeat protein
VMAATATRGVDLCGVLHTEPFLLPAALVVVDCGAAGASRAVARALQKPISVRLSGADESSTVTPLESLAGGRPPIRVRSAGQQGAVELQHHEEDGAMDSQTVMEAGVASLSHALGEELRAGRHGSDVRSSFALRSAAVEQAYEVVRGACAALVTQAADAALFGAQKGAAGGAGPRSGGRLVLLVAGDIGPREDTDDTEGVNLSPMELSGYVSRFLLHRLPGDLARSCLWRYTTLPVVLRFYVGDAEVFPGENGGEMTPSELSRLSHVLGPVAEEYFDRRGFVSLLAPTGAPPADVGAWTYLYTNEFDSTVVCYSENEAYDALAGLFLFHCEETLYARAHPTGARRSGSGGTLYLIGGVYIASSAIAITEWRKVDWLAAANWRFFPRLFLLNNDAPGGCAVPEFNVAGVDRRQLRARTWVRPAAFLDCLDYDACPSRQDDASESEASGTALKKAVRRAREAGWDFCAPAVARDDHSSSGRHSPASASATGSRRSGMEMMPFLGSKPGEVCASVLDFCTFLQQHGQHGAALAVLRAYKTRFGRELFHPQLRKVLAESFWNTRFGGDAGQFSQHARKARRHWLGFAESFRSQTTLVLPSGSGSGSGSGSAGSGSPPRVDAELASAIAVAYCRAGKYAAAAEFAIQALRSSRNILVAYEVVAHATLRLCSPESFDAHRDSKVVQLLLSRQFQEVLYTYFACVQPLMFQQYVAQRARTHPETTTERLLEVHYRDMPAVAEYLQRDPCAVQNIDDVLAGKLSDTRFCCAYCNSPRCKSLQTQSGESVDLVAEMQRPIEETGDELVDSLCIFTNPQFFYDAWLRQFAVGSDRDPIKIDAQLLSLVFSASFLAERMANISKARILYEKALRLVSTAAEAGVPLQNGQMVHEMYATFLYQQVFMKNLGSSRDRESALFRENLALIPKIKGMYEAVVKSLEAELRPSAFSIDHARANYGGFMLAAARYIALTTASETERERTARTVADEGFLNLDKVLYSEDLLEREPDLASECWFLSLLHSRTHVAQTPPNSPNQSQSQLGSARSDIGRTIECLENLKTVVLEYAGKSMHWDFTLSIANYRGPLLWYGTGAAPGCEPEHRRQLGIQWLRKLNAVITLGRPPALLREWPGTQFDGIWYRKCRKCR